MFRAVVCWCDQHSGLGEWVAAVATFAAVVAAFVISVLQQKWINAREKEKRKALTNIVLLTLKPSVDSVIYHVNRVEDWMSKCRLEANGNKSWFRSNDLTSRVSVCRIRFPTELTEPHPLIRDIDANTATAFLRFWQKLRAYDTHLVAIANGDVYAADDDHLLKELRELKQLVSVFET